MMNEPRRPLVVEIDMTPDGQFTGPAGGPAPVGSRIMRVAVIVGVLSVLAALVALTLWVALALIPIAIGLAVIGYLTMRFQLWRRGGSGGRGSPWR